MTTSPTPRLQANEHGAGVAGENGSVCTIVSHATFDHECATDILTIQPRNWRSIVRNRVTACCDYGGSQRIHAVY